MPVVAFDPGSSLATDEKGRRFTVDARDVPPGMPTYVQWMTASDVQTPATSTPAPAAAPQVAPAPPARRTAAEVLSALDQVPRTGAPPPAGAPKPTAREVLAKRDAVLPPVVSVDSTRSVQRGLTPGQMRPALDAMENASEVKATNVEQEGAASTQRAQQRIQAQATSAVQRGLEAGARRQQAAAEFAQAQRAQALATAEKDPEIDPGRFVKNLGLGRSVLLTLLASLTGAADQLRGFKGENGVVTQLNRAVDADMEAQKQAIADGRVQRGNRIQFWREKGFSAQQAEAAARVEYNEQAARLAELQADMIGTPEAAQRGRQIAADIRAEGKAAREAFVVANGTDRISEGSTTHRETPKPKDAQEAFTKMLAARQAYEEGGATPEQLARFDKDSGLEAAGLAPKGKSKTQRANEKPTEAQAKKADQMSTLEGLRDSLVDLPDTVYTPESSNVLKRGAHGAADFLFGEGSGEQLDLTLSEKDLADSQRFTQARSSFLSVLSQLNGQGAMSDPEYRNNIAAAQAANSPKKLREAIDNALRARGGGKRTDIQVEDR